MRPGGRAQDALRPVRITRGAQEFAEGSALIEMGRTRVLCAASVETSVPPFLRGTGRGWITAEYGMLPRATVQRNSREAKLGRPGGRTQEIQRLIGRSLRAVADLGALPDTTVTVDCDVLVADGGTRTASITGGYVALYDALRSLVEGGRIPALPLADQVAAVSVGIVDGRILLDLDYEEDSGASVDMNVVATASGRLVEVQGTAEGEPFPRADLDRLLDAALAGIDRLARAQREALGIA